jgi:hypothetical protein
MTLANGFRRVTIYLPTTFVHIANFILDEFVTVAVAGCFLICGLVPSAR